MDEATFMGSNSQHTPWPSTYVTGGEMRACKGVRRDTHMHSPDMPGLQFTDSRQELRVIAGRRMSALRRAKSIAGGGDLSALLDISGGFISWPPSRRKAVLRIEFGAPPECRQREAIQATAEGNSSRAGTAEIRLQRVVEGVGEADRHHGNE